MQCVVLCCRVNGACCSVVQFVAMFAQCLSSVSTVLVQC